MGLTRKQEEAHQRASDLIFGSDKLLKPDEVWFCLENWDPRAANLVSKTQAYFTPMALAMSATMNIAAPGRHILDLCAGTGRLSFALLQNCYWDPEVEITAVEINPDYVAVGKRLLPRVNWIEADALDLALWQRLCVDHHFFCAVSNPPFGRTQTLADTTWLNLHGQKACFLIAEIGLRITQVGILAVFPQSDAPLSVSAVSLMPAILRLNRTAEGWRSSGKSIQTWPGAACPWIRACSNGIGARFRRWWRSLT